ncbi:MAG: hypothetical protein EHM77_07775 [Planctomycetaceae bacterium]|nr:MAG: hypothetical protein EHM77_07775 [Planctomycetaceae bacterium]
MNSLPPLKIWQQVPKRKRHKKSKRQIQIWHTKPHQVAQQAENKLQKNLENPVTTLDSQVEHQHQISANTPVNHGQIKISETIRAHLDQIAETAVQTNGLQTEMTVDPTVELHPEITSTVVIPDIQKNLSQIRVNTEIHPRIETTVVPTVDQITAPIVVLIIAPTVKDH